MTKTWWTIIAISAGTDGLIAFVAAYQAAMTEASTGELPALKTVVVCVAGGLLIFARTIQQALKTVVERFNVKQAQNGAVPQVPPNPGT